MIIHGLCYNWLYDIEVSGNSFKNSGIDHTVHHASKLLVTLVETAESVNVSKLLIELPSRDCSICSTCQQAVNRAASRDCSICSTCQQAVNRAASRDCSIFTTCQQAVNSAATRDCSIITC